ncbi:hypothetical protein LZ906_015705 [Paraclostridium ghonii]|uniref:hypothetical protein n=1 Tax=Paraclostridium ghonii TaxID=29358 RepID=UPI0035254C19
MIEIIFTTSFIEHIKEKYDYLKNNNFYKYKKIFLANIKQYIVILENKEEVLESRYKFKDFKNKFLSFLGEKLW